MNRNNQMFMIVLGVLSVMNGLTGGFKMDASFNDVMKDTNAELKRVGRMIEQNIPHIDDKGDIIIVSMHIPKIDRDTLRVSVKNKMLTVRARHDVKNEVKREGYYRSEANSNVFNSSVILPCLTDKKVKPKITVKDSVLIISLMKKI